MQYERIFGNVQGNTDMLSFPDIYDTFRLAGNTYFFGIAKREYRSKNCVLFENVFFVDPCLSHVINRRRVPITKSPNIICVCIAIIYLYVNITNAIHDCTVPQPF